MSTVEFEVPTGARPGQRLSVQTPAGPLDVEIPPGAAAGHRLRAPLPAEMRLVKGAAGRRLGALERAAATALTQDGVLAPGLLEGLLGLMDCVGTPADGRYPEPSDRNHFLALQHNQVRARREHTVEPVGEP